MKTSLTIILAIFAVCLGRWETPYEVMHSYKGKPSIYTDNDSGVSHVMWCSEDTRSLYYIRYYYNNSISPLVHPPWDYPCSSNVLIDGLHDRKTIYVTFQAKRSSTDKSCANDPKGCEEIFFAESNDGGLTWSKAIPVPRDNMDDKENRDDPRMLITNTKRIWLFYRHSGLKEGNYSYVSRSPGSSIFTREKNLPITVYRSSITFNYYQEKYIISIFYGLSDSNDEFRYYTENNGVTWKKEDVSNYCNGEAIRIKPFTSITTASRLFVICQNGEYVNHLKISKNMGKTWTTTLIPGHTCTDRIVVAGDGKDDGYIAYGEMTIYYMKFGDAYFSRVVAPPVPSFNSCRVLTTSYRRTKFWYWFEVLNKGEQSFGLWVVWNNFEEETSTN